MSSSFVRQCIAAFGALSVTACGSASTSALDTTDAGPDAALPVVDADSAPDTKGVHIQVVNAQTGLPVREATVVADGRMGTTDAAGEVTMAAGSVARLEVQANGFVPTTWISAPGRELLVRLAPAATPATQGQRLRGSLKALETLEAPDPDHVWQAHIFHTFALDLAGVGDGLKPRANETATCVRGETDTGACSFEIETHPGPQIVYALLTDVDTRGTEQLDDDVAAPVGIAVSSLIDVAPDSTTADITLTPISSAALQAAKVALVESPLGASAFVVGIPGVRLKEGGGVMLFPTESGEVLLPPRADAVGEAAYWLVAETSITEAGGDRVRLRSVRRELEPDDFVLGAWPPILEAPTRDGRLLKLAAASFATLYTLRLRDAQGAPVRDALLVGADTIELSQQDLSASTTVEVTAIGAELPADVFDVQAVRQKVFSEASRASEL
jgi:hypothetical protein